jgi:hypothetical protein
MISRIWKRVQGFDIQYRPPSYFWPLPLDHHLMGTVKGTTRREILRHLRQGEAIPQTLAKEALPDELRKAMGRLHPSLMGGEYLTDLAAGEIEIARISLQSVTGDVIVVRARRVPTGIAYRMVDEYETKYRVRPARSKTPLSMLELIRLIESARPSSPTINVLVLNAESGWDELRSFVTVTSPFYSELKGWYTAYLNLWLDGKARRGSSPRP